jgi:hypothetical protein
MGAVFVYAPRPGFENPNLLDTAHSWSILTAKPVPCTSKTKEIPLTKLYPELTPIAGELYSQVCDRLESAVHRVIDSCDVSERGIALLAFALMEAPSDFDYPSSNPPFARAHAFLSTQSEEVRERFRHACESHPTRAYAVRIDALLK